MSAGRWNPFRRLEQRIDLLNQELATLKVELAATKLEAQRRSVYLGDHTVLARLYTGHKIYLDSRDLSIAVHLMQDGKWETWVERVITGQLKPGMTFCDVGANFGYYSILAAQCVWPSGKVFSIECNPRLIELLSQSIVVNGLDPIIRLLPFAASNSAAEIEFVFTDKFSGGGTNLDANLSIPASHQKINVRSERLDNLIPAGSPVNVLKIDVEGWESNVFDGADRIMSSSAMQAVVFEFSAASVARFRPPEELLKKISAYGFKLQLIEQNGLQPVCREGEIVHAAGDRLVYVFASK